MALPLSIGIGLATDALPPPPPPLSPASPFGVRKRTVLARTSNDAPAVPSLRVYTRGPPVFSSTANSPSTNTRRPWRDIDYKSPLACQTQKRETMRFLLSTGPKHRSSVCLSQRGKS